MLPENNGTCRASGGVWIPGRAALARDDQEGPPCFRADRAALRQVLFLSHMLIFEHFNEDDVEFALTEKQNPYAVFGELRAGMSPILTRAS
jgi:hypothetical protein